MGVVYNSRIITDSLVLCLDAANTKSYPTKNFVSSKIYSSFGSSIRSSNYTVQYSDDNSNWTTAFTGVASNNTSCGIQQNTGSGSGSYGLHRYWRYVEGSPIQSHHPRVSRIILTDINGIDYNLVVYTSDNCSDTGTYQVGTVSLDFGGTTWADLSTNGNTGTLTNGPTYSSANGGSLVFDGSNDYVTTSLVTSLSNNVTISSWFRTFNASQAGQMVIYNGSDANGNGYGFAVNNESTTNGEILLLYGAIAWINTGFFAASNVIYNATMVIESDNSNKLYINGNLVHSGISRNINTPTNHTEIGRNDYPAARYFNGNIAQTQIYNRALSAAEIAQNYNALRGRFGI